MEDPSKDPQYAEPAVDNMREQKNKVGIVFFFFFFFLGGGGGGGTQPSMMKMNVHLIQTPCGTPRGYIIN